MKPLYPNFFSNLLSAFTSLISGCAISTPQRLLQLAAGEAPDDLVFVVITRANIKPEMRSTFDDLASKLAKTLPSQPGLITYSLRREIFGTQEWTLTAWKSAYARDAFGGSPAHRGAMKLTSILVNDMDVHRFVVRRDELPLSWTDALAKLPVTEAEKETFVSVKKSGSAIE
ncbi:MAG: antibiotic biosynthesis monooxygenase [Burkholderiaceae bacterium]|nr:antibiotic biosynthesis monooxygenase [Burkholderiaceae bacterium]